MYACVPGSVRLLLPSALVAESVGVGVGVGDTVVDAPSADEEPRNVLPLLLPLSAQGETPSISDTMQLMYDTCLTLGASNRARLASKLQQQLRTVLGSCTLGSCTARRASVSISSCDAHISAPLC